MRALLAAAVLLLPFAGAAAGPGDATDPRARFLADGDAAALAAALAREGEDPGRTDALLAHLGADARWAPADAAADGYGAWPQVVAALRRVDLAGATARAARLGPDGETDAGPCLGALLLARGGRRAEATRRLAVAGRSTPARAFRVALLGAVLPEDDRLLLGAALREAVADAARRADAATLRRLAADAVALDRDDGTEAVVLAARALRRSGQGVEDVWALAAPRSPSARARLAVARAQAAWLAGDAPRARSLLAGVAPDPWDADLVRALSSAGAVDVRGPALPASAVGDADRDAALAARLATLLGRPTRAEEVVVGAPRPGAAASSALRAAVEARGLVVLPLAGGGAVLDAVLDAGLPALVLVPARRGEAFRETPFLVRGRDRATGLLRLDELDVARPDVALSAALAKGVVLAAAPAERAAALAPWRGGSAERLGLLLDAAHADEEQGRLDAALARLEAERAAFEGTPAFDLRRALLHHAAAVAHVPERGVDAAAIARSGEAVRRSLAVPPATPIERFLEAQALAAARKLPEALAALAEAERLGGATTWILRARFAVQKETRRHADALATVRAAWRLDPGDAAVLHQRGLEQDDPAAMRADLRRALDLSPATVRIAADLATLDVDGGRPRDALAVVAEVAARDPAAAAREDLRAIRRAAELALLQAAGTIAELAPFAASPEPDTRRWLAFALASREEDASERVLRTLLADADTAVRVSALRVYMRPWFRARVEADEALSARVADALTKDPDPLVRGAAGALLSLVDLPFAETTLAGRVAGPGRDRDPYPRSAAAAALARHGGPVSRAALVAALEDEDATVRRSAIDALFRIASTHHGYDPEAARDARAAAVERWKAWLKAGT